MLGKFITNVRNSMPFIHSITNYVTVNDVANIILACSASPMMSDEPAEVEDITSFCDGLNINMGTVNKRSIEAMFLAGKQSNLLRHVVVLNPEGADASPLRADTATDLIYQVSPTVICGNLSEMKTLAQKCHMIDEMEYLSPNVEENLESSIKFLQSFSQTIKCILVLTGKVSLVSDGRQCYVIYNGVPQLEHVVGISGQLSAMITAFLVSSPGEELMATAAAVCTLGIAAENAWEKMEESDGEIPYKDRIINAVYQVQAEHVDRQEKYEVRSLI